MIGIMSRWRDSRRGCKVPPVNPNNSIFNRTAAPVTQPDSPAGMGETRVAQPDSPAGMRETPVAQPDSPSGMGETRVAQPDSPAGMRETRVAQPDSPAGMRETPVTQPDSRAGRGENTFGQRACAKEGERPVPLLRAARSGQATAFAHHSVVQGDETSPLLDASETAHHP